jgi:hypothetical protein
MLGPELVVHIIMDSPEPFAEIFLTFCRIGLHILGQALTTVFAGKNIWKSIEKGADILLVQGGCRETYKM